MEYANAQFKYFFLTIVTLFVSETTLGTTYYSCQGTGEYKGVSLAGYGGFSISAGPYTCIGGKRADYYSGTPLANQKVVAKGIWKTEDGYLSEILSINYYAGTRSIIRDTKSRKNFLVAVVDWKTSDDPELKVVTFNCRHLKTENNSSDLDYFGPCHDDKTNKFTRALISGAIKPMTAEDFLPQIQELLERAEQGKSVSSLETLFNEANEESLEDQR